MFVSPLTIPIWFLPTVVSLSTSELLTIAGISRTVPLSPELTLRIFETNDGNLFLTYFFKSVKYVTLLLIGPIVLSIPGKIISLLLLYISIEYPVTGLLEVSILHSKIIGKSADKSNVPLNGLQSVGL